jgi:hypothetical protein
MPAMGGERRLGLPTKWGIRIGHDKKGRFVGILDFISAPRLDSEECRIDLTKRRT